MLSFSFTFKTSRDMSRISYLACGFVHDLDSEVNLSNFLPRYLDTRLRYLQVGVEPQICGFLRDAGDGGHSLEGDSGEGLC